MRDFDTWLAQFRDSISNYNYYTDFKKVIENARPLKAELHILNSLIGSNDIEVEFRELLKNYPSILRAIPILLAKRESEIYARDDEGGGVYNFGGMVQDVDEYCVFMRKTGLFDLISKHLVNNLYDYVVGVETGLDSNGRKNRGGHLMEEVKRFDFVVKTSSCVYAIETNFYGSGGSKLNETARSYKMLAIESQNIKGFKFVWFTDGAGWRSARQNLRETFDVLPTVFNIKEIEDGVMSSLFI